MTILVNGAESGIAGQYVTSIEPSGSPSSPFDVVDVGDDTSSFTYDGTHGGAHGSLAFKMALGMSPSTASVGWQSTFLAGAASVGAAYLRAYLFLDSDPINAVTLLRWVNRGSQARVNEHTCGAVKINTQSQLYLVDASEVTLATMDTAIPHGQWVRVEGLCVGSTNHKGTLEAKLFTGPDNMTPMDAISVAGVDTHSAINRVKYGSSTSVTNVTFWLDDLGACDTGYVGPVNSFAAGVGSAFDATAGNGAASPAASPPLAAGTAYDAVGYASAALAGNNFTDNALATSLATAMSQAENRVFCTDVPAGYPDPPFVLRLGHHTSNYEKVLVTGGSGVPNDPWIVQRGYHDTSPVFHNAGASVTHAMGASDVMALMSAIAIVGINPPDGVRVAPVGTLYLRLDGGPNTTAYIKESGHDASGWRPLRGIGPRWR